MRTRRTTKTRSNSSNKRNTTNNNAHKTNRSCLTKSNLQRNTFLVGMAVSSALVLTRPLMPAVLYAATITNTYDWTKQNLAGVGDFGINNVAMSADGRTLISSTYNFSGGEDAPEPTLADFPLHISTNAGASWQNVAPTIDSDVAYAWSAVDISNDGQTMVASSAGGANLETEAEIPGKIFISQNAGTTWTDISAGIPPLEGGESQVVVSGDGGTLAVIGAYEYNEEARNRVYVSENKGASWTSVEISDDALDGTPSYLSVSDNGDKQLVGLLGGSGSEFDSVFISEDSGNTWSDITPPLEDASLLHPTAMSADGSKIAVSTMISLDGGDSYNSSVFISTNDGQTWTDATPAGAADNSVWGSIAMSDDGNTLAVFGVELNPNSGPGVDIAPNSMYVSRNGGSSWTQEDHTEDGSNMHIYNYVMSNLDLNSTGSRIILGSIEGIYTGTAMSSGPSTALTNAETGKPVVLSTPAGTIITCHTAVKEAGLSAKDVAYTYPLGLVDFCFSGAEASNEIRVIFVTDLKPEQVVARKYHTTNGSYSTLTDASITATTYEGKAALQVTYTIEDNGPLDLNPVTGEVSDPVGLAVAELGAPATGIAPANSTNSTNTRLTTLLTGLAVTTSLLMLPIRRAVSSVSRVMSSK